MVLPTYLPKFYVQCALFKKKLPSPFSVLDKTLLFYTRWALQAPGVQMWKAEEQIPILYQVSITGSRSPDVKGRRTNTYFIPGEHYRLPVAFGLLFLICCLNTEFCVCFVEEWKDLTGKVSKANTAKCEAQAKLSDLQSSMVTSEVRNYR
jgi:hypothetical protein